MNPSESKTLWATRPKTLWQITKEVADFFQDSVIEETHNSISLDVQAWDKAKKVVQKVYGLTSLAWACALQETRFCKRKLEWLLGQKEKSRAPLSRWLGTQWFWKHEFVLNEATLDPRWESEGLVALALSKFQYIQRILDLGTGTGCLLISLLDAFPEAKGVGIDCSARALQAALRNAHRSGVARRATWIQSHWWEKVQGSFDCIISNPPYVKRTDPLPLEVQDWDPSLALDGGEDGLDAYRQIIPCVSHFLRPQGVLLLEIGQDQGPTIVSLLQDAGLQGIQILPDACGRNRYGIAYRRG